MFVFNAQHKYQWHYSQLNIYTYMLISLKQASTSISNNQHFSQQEVKPYFLIYSELVLEKRGENTLSI